MRPGKVTTLRINPQDCMAIVDVCKALGIPLTGATSFSQATKIALASCLESLRQSGTIPTRDGFEYSEMMRAFPDQNDYSMRGVQLKIANISMHPDVHVAPIKVDHERARRKIQYEELLFKYKQDAVNFSDEDMQALVPLMAEFQPSEQQG